MSEATFVRGQFSVDPLTGAEVAPGDAPPQGLSALMSASRLVYPGDGALPVEDIPLDGDEGVGEPGTDAAPSSAAPGVPVPDTPVPDAEREALLARLNALEAELATLRTSAPVPVKPLPAAEPIPLDYEPLVKKVGRRFQETFTDVEGYDPADPTYNEARADRFGRSVIQAVLEDILPDQQVIEARLRPSVEPHTRATVREELQQDRLARTEQDALGLAIQRAVAVSRAAGYDVHPPGTKEHLESPESRLFWGAATQVDQTIPVDDQITQTLALLPAKTVPARTTTPSPGAASVRQPMARQGMGRTQAPQTTPAEEEYRPKKLGDMLNETRNLRVVA